MFRGSKYSKLFVRVYSIANVLEFASLIFVFSMLGGFFNDAVGTILWQHLVRIIIFADAVLILSTLVVFTSLVISVPIIWKNYVFIYFIF